MALASELDLDPLTDPLPCHWCGRRQPWRVPNQMEHPEAALTTDHVVPRASGGRTGRSNLVLACYACNQQRARHWYGCQECARGDFCLLGLYYGVTVVRQCQPLCLLRPIRLRAITVAAHRKRTPKVLHWLVRRAHGQHTGSGPWLTTDGDAISVTGRPRFVKRPKAFSTAPARAAFNPPRVTTR